MIDQSTYYYEANCRSLFHQERPSASMVPQGIVCSILRSSQMFEKNLTSACCFNMVVMGRESIFCCIQGAEAATGGALYKKRCS